MMTLEMVTTFMGWGLVVNAVMLLSPLLRGWRLENFKLFILEKRQDVLGGATDCRLGAFYDNGAFDEFRIVG